MTVIHPTAIVHPGAQLGEGVEIGAYSIVGPRVIIGDRTVIMPHVFLDGSLTLGKDCKVFPFASLGTQTQDRKYKGGETFVTIGDRTVVREYVTVNAGTAEGETTAVGTDCLLMATCHVAHKCVVGNDVIIGNAGMLAGHVIVEDFAVIAGVTGVHQFVRIGRMSIIGGCSKINQDVPPYVMVDGNPASARGLNQVAMERRGIPQEVRSALKTAFKRIFLEKLPQREAIERIRAEFPGIPEVEQFVHFIETSERGITR